MNVHVVADGGIQLVVWVLDEAYPGDQRREDSCIQLNTPPGPFGPSAAGRVSRRDTRSSARRLIGHGLA